MERKSSQWNWTPSGNMEIQYWAVNTLPDKLCTAGLAFIRRRFKEDWGVTRDDVSYALLMGRRNLTLFDGDQLVGWLGLESDNEFTNACIERGYSGTRLLGMMIQEALVHLPKENYFAFVPVSRTGSARAFISNGFNFKSDSPIKVQAYPEGDIELVHLERLENTQTTAGSTAIGSQLDQMRRLKNGNIG